MPPAPPQGILAAGGDPGRDGDDDDAGGSSSHGTKLSEEPELDGWIARPITRDAARGCHFHDALDTLLRRTFDRHTWSIEYRCVVYQHRRGLYPDQWEATCLVRRLDDDLWGAEAFSEHYSITERDMLGRRRRRYPSLQAFVNSLHQRRQDNRSGPPFVLFTARRRPTTKSLHPTSSPDLEAHVGFGPL
jgi:hypothetical protein